MPLRGVGNCQYTALAAAGTTTLNPGPPAGVQNQPAPDVGAFYGVEYIATGTSFVANVYDLIGPTPNGTSTATTTNTLLNGTGTAGQLFTPGPSGLGVRYRGALVIVMSGTAGAVNALWD